MSLTQRAMTQASAKLDHFASRLTKAIRDGGHPNVIDALKLNARKYDALVGKLRCRMAG